MYNLTIIAEVFYALFFIPSVINEWNKLPIVSFKENSWISD